MRCALGYRVTAAKWWMSNNAMAVERYTLNQWLQAKREQFITYTIEEIAELALACGYTEKEVEASILKRDRRFL